MRRPCLRFFRVVCFVGLIPLVWSAQGPAQEPETGKGAEIDALKPQLCLDTGGHTGRIMKLFFTADGKQLVSVGRDQTIRFWDVLTGELVRVLRSSFHQHLPNGPQTTALTPDGGTLV